MTFSYHISLLNHHLVQLLPTDSLNILNSSNPHFQIIRDLLMYFWLVSCGPGTLLGLLDLENENIGPVKLISDKSLIHFQYNYIPHFGICPKCKYVLIFFLATLIKAGNTPNSFSFFQTKNYIWLYQVTSSIPLCLRCNNQNCLNIMNDAVGNVT